MSSQLPGARAAIADKQGLPTPEFYRFLLGLQRLSAGSATSADIAALQTQIAAIQAEIDGLPKSSFPTLQVTAPLTSSGLLQNGFAKLGVNTINSVVVNGNALQLSGDVSAPGNTYFYGSSVTGAKGWQALSGVLHASANVAVTFAADGTATFDLKTLADSGAGTFKLLTRDAYGRLTGTKDGTTSDVPEGTNLYYTDTRADARITAQKGQPNGLATLGADSKLDSGQLPALAITDTFVVSTEAAMLALDCQQGDVAVRTDLSKSFILTASPPSTLSNWQELLTPGGGVDSFNGRTGSVTPATGDYTFAQISDTPTTLAGYGITDAEPAITDGTTAQYWRGDKSWQTLNKAAVGLGSVDNTSDADKPVSDATQQALNAKANTDDLGSAAYQPSSAFLSQSKANSIGLTSNLQLTGDLNSPRTEDALFFSTISTTTNQPSGVDFGAGIWLGNGQNNGIMLLGDTNPGTTLAWRAHGGQGWGAWNEIWHAGNTLALGSTAESARSALNLGSAATTSSSDYATAAQGVKADSAVQPNTQPNFSGIRVAVPSDFWTSSPTAFLGGSGYVGTNGSSALSLRSNGYRNTGGGWTSLSAGGYTKGSGIDLMPDGSIRFLGGTPSGKDVPQIGGFDTDGNFFAGAASFADTATFRNSPTCGGLSTQATSSTNSGFVEFRMPDWSRAGYVGYADAGGLSVVAEGGRTLKLSGSQVSLIGPVITDSTLNVGGSVTAPNITLGGGKKLTKITVSSAAPGTLADGELYLQY